MPTRTINYNFDLETLHAITQLCSTPKVHEALGRLTAWGFGSERYARVEVYAEYKAKEYYNPPIPDAQFTAAFFDVHGQRTFVMGAVWHYHTAEFGFHS